MKNSLNYDIVLDENEEHRGQIKVKKRENGFDLKFTYPVNFTSQIYGKGQIDLGLQLEFHQNYNSSINKNMWEIDLTHYDEAEIVNFGCLWHSRDISRCTAFEEHLKTDFRKTLIDFKNEPIWSQPTALRQFTGLMKYINEFNQNDFNTLHAMVSED